MTSKKHLYFNINYICNSRCIFCASDNYMSPERGIIDYDDFHAAVSSYHIGKGDLVTINGGEPTLSNDIVSMLSLVQSTGAYCDLFTNGRLLADISFAENVFRSINGYVYIPLFGVESSSHDALTRSKGSFEETIRGIDNFFDLRERYKLPIRLELKLLFAKPLLDINPLIAEMILKDYPTTDRISLNSIIQGKEVKAKDALLVPTLRELKESFHKTLSVFRKSELDIDIRTMPFCMLNKWYYHLLFKSFSCYDRYHRIYFDPNYKSGIDTSSKGVEASVNYIYEGREDDFNPWIQEGVDRLCYKCPLFGSCTFRITTEMITENHTRNMILRMRNRLVNYLSKSKPSGEKRNKQGRGGSPFKGL